jgi:hypothetical protein
MDGILVCSPQFYHKDVVETVTAIRGFAPGFQQVTIADP